MGNNRSSSIRGHQSTNDDTIKQPRPSQETTSRTKRPTSTAASAVSNYLREVSNLKPNMTAFGSLSSARCSSIILFCVWSSAVWRAASVCDIISSPPCRTSGAKSMLSTSTLISRRRTKSALKSSTPIQNSVRRKYHKSAVILANANLHRVSDEPSLEELRAQLGPIAMLISNTIELTVITIGSYISGGLLGYFGGSILNIPSTMFDKTTKGITSKFGALHAKAWGTCKQWGMLSAAFSGFNNFVRMVRGDQEDGWNAVLGSALTGAFLNRSGKC